MVLSSMNSNRGNKAIWYLLHHGHAQCSLISRNEWIEQHNARAVEGQEEFETRTIF